jgi:pSer/pThr/pTyr-binding forkhead associated (FHA) protein
MASLLVTKGLSRGDFYPLKDTPLTLGRASDGDGQVIDDNVSRQHVRFEWDSTARLHSVTDLGSRNGTRVNGQSISGATLLKDGDEITIGETSIRFTTQDFPTRENAMTHFRERRWFGEDLRQTIVER